MTTGVSMTKAGTTAHRDERIGSSLGEFRGLLQDGSPGFRTTRRPEVSKSNQGPDGFRKMIDDGVACVLMLGSDITVRPSIDATVGDGVDHVLRSGALPTDDVGTFLGVVDAFADTPPIPGHLDFATAGKFKIEPESKMPWGVDRGDRTPTKIFDALRHSGAARICQANGAA